MQINSAYIPLLDNRKRYLVMKGGAGSGKSVFALQKKLLRMTTEPGHRFLVVRKVAKTIRSSVFQLVKDLISQHNLGYRFEVNKTEMRFRDKLNGNEMFMVGMDDPEKIKSIAGITGIFIEEVTELAEEDFDQLDLRLRGHTQNYKQIIAAFNPIDEEHWLKAKFFDVDRNDTFTITTTYKDNAFLDDEYIKVLNESIKGNDILYRVYALGEWGRTTTGGEFYKMFKYGKHVVKNLEYDESLPLHTTFDFNVNPHMTDIVCQIDGKQVRILNEICLEDPYNTTPATCREFDRIYRTHQSGLLIYGDATSRKRNTITEKGENEFKVIENELKRYHPTTLVPKANPPVAMRGNFINAVFGEEFEGISILIDESCKKTIADFMYTKQASDGTKFKEMTTNPKTKIRYQKYGHCTDALDYLLCEAFAAEYRIFTTGSRGSIARSGTYRRTSRARG